MELDRGNFHSWFKEIFQTEIQSRAEIYVQKSSKIISFKSCITKRYNSFVMKTTINAVRKNSCYLYTYYIVSSWVWAYKSYGRLVFKYTVQKLPLTFLIRIKFKAIKQKYVEMVSVFTNRLFCLFRLFYTALTLEVFIKEKTMYLSWILCLSDFIIFFFPFIHRITKPQNNLCWKGLLQVTKPSPST